ncbi:MAG: hypothetical protein WKF96_01300 [Solirubrobacteraceae bacterium]
MALIAQNAYRTRLMALAGSVAANASLVADPVFGSTVALALPGGEMIRGQFAGGDAGSVLLDRAELIAGGAVQPLGGRQTVKRGAWMQDFGLSEPVSEPVTA